MRHLGLLSYGMYLFHIPVIIILRPYNLAQEQLFLAFASLTWVIAIVGYLAVEKPFLLLKPKSVRYEHSTGDVDAVHGRDRCPGPTDSDRKSTRPQSHQESSLRIQTSTLNN